MTTFNTQNVSNDDFVSSFLDECRKGNLNNIHSQPLEANDKLSFLLSSSYLNDLEKLINYKFNNRMYLLCAISHRSFCNEFSSLGIASFERLEFLGDALLDLYVSKILYFKYPDFNEGQLSKFRSSLVNKNSLYELGKLLNLPRYILVGKGEFKNQGHKQASIISDIFESLGAAVYLDSSFENYNTFMDFIIKTYEEFYCDDFFALDRLEKFDAKTKLQEKSMALKKILPRYETVQKCDGLFESKIFLLDEYLSKGIGKSKREAEKQAAEEALALNIFKE